MAHNQCTEVTTIYLTLKTWGSLWFNEIQSRVSPPPAHSFLLYLWDAAQNFDLEVLEDFSLNLCNNISSLRRMRSFPWWVFTQVVQIVEHMSIKLVYQEYIWNEAWLLGCSRADTNSSETIFSLWSNKSLLKRLFGIYTVLIILIICTCCISHQGLLASILYYLSLIFLCPQVNIASLSFWKWICLFTIASCWCF